MSTATIAAGLLFVFGGAGAWMTWMPGDSAPASLPDASEEEIRLAEALEADVRFLADEIGERNLFTPGSMETSVQWIGERMEAIGYEPRIKPYALRGIRVPELAGREARNLVAEVPGEDKPEKILVVGAHYDSVPGSPGANDNASGMAALLALAEWFRENPQPVTLRFVAFANEEYPFFKTPDMGSYAWAEQALERGDDIIAMMSMDGIGYFSDAPDSQHYPLPGIGLLYPDQGNFIGFITRSRDASLVRRAIRAFRESASLPSEGAALPAAIDGVAFSDHWSFWQHDIPAFLVTDTLPFRDPYYHSSGDTPERLDYERMARLVKGLRATVERLARGD